MLFRLANTFSLFGLRFICRRFLFGCKANHICLERIRIKCHHQLLFCAATVITLFFGIFIECSACAEPVMASVYWHKLSLRRSLPCILSSQCITAKVFAQGYWSGHCKCCSAAGNNGIIRKQHLCNCNLDFTGCFVRKVNRIGLTKFRIFLGLQVKVLECHGFTQCATPDVLTRNLNQYSFDSFIRNASEGATGKQLVLSSVNNNGRVFQHNGHIRHKDHFF